MKTYLPFLLPPVLAALGWVAGQHAAVPAAPPMPTLPALVAPPPLGVVKPPSGNAGPLALPLASLLPPARPVTAPEPVRTAAPTLPAPTPMPAAPPPPPVVTGILIDGQRRVAFAGGDALVVNDIQGAYRVAAIQPDGVMFELSPRGAKRWVSLNQ